MARFIPLLLLSSTALLFYTCKEPETECDDPRNKNCPNYDPCIDAKELTGAFTVFETVSWLPKDWVFYDTDTLNGIDAIFTALDDNCTYEWTIGAETLTTKTVYRKSFPLNTVIPIKLKVKRVNDNCFPKADSIKQSTRKIFFNQTQFAIYNCLVQGTFIGYNADKPDSLFEVLIDTALVPRTHSNSGDVRIVGLINGCEVIFDQGGFAGYKKAYLARALNANCSSPEVLAEVSGTAYENIRIDYTKLSIPGDATSSRIKNTFIGKRKQ